MSDRSIWCRHALLPDGWHENVRLDLSADGLIVEARPAERRRAEVTLDGVVVPGMPNLHSHGFQRLMVGLTGERRTGVDSFWGWRRAMYDFANRLTPEQLSDCMGWVYAEMLCAGYTSCAEFHYLHHQPDGTPYARRAEMSLRVLQAADEAGIAVSLLPVLYQASGFGSAGVEPHQRRFANSLDDYIELLADYDNAVRDSEWHRLGVAPHSLRAVPPESLSQLLRQLPEADTPIHIHVAEQPAEVEACLRQHGARPVEWLLANAPVGPHWCLVHATHMDEAECEQAAHTGAVAGLCPTTEADLGDGFFETPAWLAAGGVFGIGSDSNLRISVAEELRLLEFTARLRSGARQVLRSPELSCGRFLYQRAAIGGARALAQPVGQLASGCRADLVELDPGHPLLAGRHGDQWLEAYVFGGGEGMVRSVFVGGQQQVAEGRHRDQDRLRERFCKVSAVLAAS